MLVQIEIQFDVLNFFVDTMIKQSVYGVTSYPV